MVQIEKFIATDEDGDIVNAIEQAQKLVNDWLAKKPGLTLDKVRIETSWEWDVHEEDDAACIIIVTYEKDA
ncbi:MAG: hypothetical protein HC837_08300 [Chloroflexaceae bacterium]|nr:hypothetical protein [Chloroflexaceae bacterium]